MTAINLFLHFLHLINLSRSHGLVVWLGISYPMHIYVYHARFSKISYCQNILILPWWPYLKTAKKWNIFHPSHIIRRLHEYLSLASLVLIHSNLRRSKVVYNAYFYTVILHSRRAYFKPLSILHLPPHYFSSLFWELSVHGTLILMAIASLE